MSAGSAAQTRVLLPGIIITSQEIYGPGLCLQPNVDSRLSVTLQRILLGLGQRPLLRRLFQLAHM